MKPTFLLVLAFTAYGAFAQKGHTPNQDFRIIDVAQKQMRIANAYKDKDSLTRSRVFADSLYQPYKSFWSGYIGEEADYVEWMNNRMLPRFSAYVQRNEQINGDKLLRQFDEVKTAMVKLTGYSPKGAWYVVYGPAWTNLGGLSGGTMLIDLAHGNNSSNENIMMSFPHEITHQIYANVNTHRDTTAMSSIIGEGFAVYMNKLYWGDKYTLAQHLGFTDAEMQACGQHHELIRKYFEAHKYSTDKEAIMMFRNRGSKLQTDLPGAIGYYIGYRIVEQYVKKYGATAWKDVFTKSPKEIYRLSGY